MENSGKNIETLPLSPADREVVQNRTAEIRAQYLLDEGEAPAATRRIDQARTSLSEANAYLRRSKVSLVLVRLAISPRATRKLASLMEGLHNWSNRYLPGQR